MDLKTAAVQNNQSSGFIKGNVLNEVMNLLDTLKRENNAQYKVMLITTAGTLVGDIEPCSPEAGLIKYTDDPALFSLDTSSIFNMLKKRYPEEPYTDSYMLNVKNAILYGSSPREEIMKVEQIIIFSDQIVGFSLIKQQ